MTKINVYLTFDGNCREAMTFYKSCLGGELFFQTLAGSPLEEEWKDADKESILHSTLTKGDMLLMASDMIGDGGYFKGNNVSVSVDCGSEEEINTFFANFSADARILMPLSKQFWGAILGVLIDQFGIKWIFNYDFKE